MSDSEDQTPRRYIQPPPSMAARAPPGPGAENQTATEGLGVSSILRRWKREDIMRKGGLALRGLASLFSLLAFIITASNEHGGGEDFHKYEEYRYLLAIAILSSLYTGIQAVRHVHQIFTGNRYLQQRTSALIDFCGDQVMAYLLISAASAAIPRTDNVRDDADDAFTDSSAAAIALAFLAFCSLALSAVISGYRLSTRSYI
ncbi:CASP-like protein 4B1 [Rhodamnia argentea]|uniref:CASP-like protein n=1 Tax=Rhodamnia argentea TaxID=178133 RepID=A0A8B8PRE4_9MYRT|nr:CASP-like protein 4B1 [Rhodamnia argentea]